MNPMNKPLMLLCSDLWLSKNEDLKKLTELGTKAQNVVYRVTVKGTSHYNFGDSFYLLQSMLGPILIPSRYSDITEIELKIIVIV
jgi:hypothetical protein